MSDRYDSDDIFDELAVVLDPERPATLADLDVISRERITVSYAAERRASIRVELKPTVPHCHFMMLIALCVRAKLYFALPVTTFWKVDIRLVPGSHLQLTEIERQCNDKERVCAALESPPLLKQVQRLIDPHSECH